MAIEALQRGGGGGAHRRGGARRPDAPVRLSWARGEALASTNGSRKALRGAGRGARRLQPAP